MYDKLSNSAILNKNNDGGILDDEAYVGMSRSSSTNSIKRTRKGILIEARYKLTQSRT